MIVDNWLTPLIEKFRPAAIIRETSATLFLTARSCVIDTLVTEGNEEMLALPIQQILRRCLEAKARQILIIHTHPSGNACPSNQDIAVTRRLCRHLRRQHLRLTDHIILTHDHYFSFRIHHML